VSDVKDVSRFIKNSDLITHIFGGWPSFHDAEIESVLLTREGEESPRMEVAIHHWTMTREVDAQGNYVLKNHTLSTLRFSGLSGLELDSFNEQNVLWDLEISTSDDPKDEVPFSVSMPSSYGCHGSFRCKRITVISAVPWPKP